MGSKTWLPPLVVAGVALILSVYQANRQEASRAELEGLREDLRRLEATLRARPSSAPAREDGRALAETVAHLEKQTALLEARMQAGPTATAGAASTEEAPTRDAPPQAKTPLPTYAESQAQVLAAYDEEVPDDAWSANAERKLGDLLRGKMPAGSRLNVLECRATMCQVEVTHKDPMAQGPFLMDGFLGWPGSLFVAGERQEHGELTVTIIASREGMEPPMGMR